MTNPNYGTYLPPRINRYVPGAKYDSNVDEVSGLTRLYFGALTLANATALNTAIAMVNGSAVTQSYSNSQGIVGGAGAPFGRTIQLVASTTNTRVATVLGVDYHGQVISENITMNSGTPVSSVKAYWKINSITWASASDTTTVNVGTGAKFGLPYAMLSGIDEFVDGVRAAGTSVLSIRTNTQTATSNDPRGLYTPGTTPDGVKIFEVTGNVDNNNVNGIYGAPHFSG